MSRSHGRPDKRTGVPGIYERGDGRFSVRHRDAEGRQRRVHAATIEDAKVIKAEEERKASRGRTTRCPVTDASVWQYAEDVLANYTGYNGGARPETVAEYRAILRRHLKGSALGRRRIVSVKPSHVRHFIETVRHSKPSRKSASARTGERRAGKTRTGKYSNATMRHLMAALRAVFGQAVTEGIFEHNPCNGIPIGKPSSNRAKRTFPDEVIKAIVAGFTAPDFHLAAEVLALTGIRISELSGLNQGDVVPIANKGWGLRISRRMRGTSIGKTKTPGSERPIPIPGDLASRLRDHAAGLSRQGDDEPMFVGLRGERMTPAVFRREFGRAVGRAAAQADDRTTVVIRTVTPHGFRHSAARRWRLKGIEMDEISAMLGHADVSTTITFYGGVLEEDLPMGDLLDF